MFPFLINLISFGIGEGDKKTPSCHIEAPGIFLLFIIKTKFYQSYSYSV